MSLKLKAIFKDGAFVPLSNGDRLNVPENSEVELTVDGPYVLSPTATTNEERKRLFRELVEGWQQHPLAPDAPRLSRDEMHERR